MRWETHRASSFGGGCVAGRSVELPVLCQEASCLLQERSHIQLVPLHHFLTYSERVNSTGQWQNQCIDVFFSKDSKSRKKSLEIRCVEVLGWGIYMVTDMTMHAVHIWSHHFQLLLNTILLSSTCYAGGTHSYHCLSLQEHVPVRGSRMEI